MRKSEWLYEEALVLFQMLVRKFGPYEDWQLKFAPIAKDKQFDLFCEQLSELFGAKSGNAIKNQIAWAISAQDYIGPSHFSTWLRNRTAAYEAGFINEEHMPKSVVCEY